MNFLDNIGLEKLWYNIISKLGKKVDKEEGKGLSTNDYTTDEKEKLAGIAAGATKVDVDSELNSKSTNAIQNKAVANMKKSIEDEINNKPSKTGEGASGTWGINISGTASKVNITTTNSSSNKSYPIPFMTSVTGSNSLLADDGIGYWALEGTTSTVGIGELKLGNDKASGTAGNKRGMIYMYGNSSGYTEIVPSNSTTNNIRVLLPSSAGTIALTSSNITGNAATANKLATARTLTIGNKGKTFNGEADVSWSLSEIGAAASDHTHSYLPLSGGTLTGNLTAKTITISGTESGLTHIKFSRDNANYICFPPSENGCLSINAENSASSVQNASLAIFSNVLKPGSNKTVDLGTSSNKWNNVYANTFYGALSGKATSATKLATARTLTIGGTGKTFDGSTNVRWSLNDIGAYSLNDRGTEIPTNADLNNYLTPGNYNVPSSAVAETIANTPFTATGYRLFCQMGYRTDYDDLRGNGYQIAVSYDGNIKFRSNYIGTWSDWFEYSKTNHIHSYLPLSGGTLTGNLTVPTITINSTSAERHIQFSREGLNYITTPSTGTLAINCQNGCASATSSLIVSSTELRPGTTNTINLGTSSFKWKNVYATTFTGALSGNATSAGKVNSNLVIKLNGGSTEGTNLFTFNGSAAKTVNITASSIGAAASSHTHSNYLSLDGGTMTGKITGVDTQTTWIGTTRNGAFRVETAASGTKAVSALSMKTNTGAWSIGNLAGEDNLYFTYGTDTNYNANSNTVNNYSISTGGAWSGSAAKLTTARTLTIGSKGKTFDGSKNVSWTLAEIGAVAKAGDTMSGKLVANATSVAALGTSQIRNIWAGTADISEVEGSLKEGDIYLQYEEG